MTALLGGHVQAVLTNYSEAVEQLHAGTVRALASASLKRIPPLPDVPTVDELGYKGYNVEVWFGVMAPAKTPKEATAQLASWFQAALKAPELTPRLLKLGLYPVGTCLDDFAKHIRSQYDEYGRIIRDAGIKAGNERLSAAAEPRYDRHRAGHDPFGDDDERPAARNQPAKPPGRRGVAIGRRLARSPARAGAERRGILPQDPGPAPDRLSGRQRLRHLWPRGRAPSRQAHPRQSDRHPGEPAGRRQPDGGEFPLQRRAEGRRDHRPLQPQRSARAADGKHRGEIRRPQIHLARQRRQRGQRLRRLAHRRGEDLERSAHARSSSPARPASAPTPAYSRPC